MVEQLVPVNTVLKIHAPSWWVSARGSPLQLALGIHPKNETESELGPAAAGAAGMAPVAAARASKVGIVKCIVCFVVRSWLFKMIGFGCFSRCSRV